MFDINVRRVVLQTMTIPQLVKAQNEMLDRLGDKQTPRVRDYKNKTIAVERVQTTIDRMRKDPRFKNELQDRRYRTFVPPSGEMIRPCLAGSKQAVLVDMLARPEGATMAELIEGLSAHKPGTTYSAQRVQTAFGWDVKSRGYGVRSEYVDGTERFFLMVPAGKRVLPHRERKSTPVQKQ